MWKTLDMKILFKTALRLRGIIEDLKFCSTKKKMEHMSFVLLNIKIVQIFINVCVYKSSKNIKQNKKNIKPKYF